MTALKGKRKAAAKIGIQYGKLLTDSRFYKPPKRKRETSFRAVASAVRESAVCLHRSFATCKWVAEFLDGTNWQGRNEDGLRPGQEASLACPCSNLRSFGSKCTVWKKMLGTLLGLFCAPCSISAPPEWFGTREIAPLWPPCYAPAD